MVPTLKIGRDKLLGNNFLNAFSNDVDSEIQYENCIFLVFHLKHLEKFKEFLDGEYERTKSLITDYNYNDDYIVLVYQLDDAFKKDFAKIKIGAYSKTSKEFQAMFPEKIAVNGSQSYSTQYKVFNQTEDLIKFWEEKLDVVMEPGQELWEMYDESKEILSQENFKKYV
jgi:hypothetical protein